MGAQLQPIRDMATVNRITEELSRLTDERGRRMFLMWVVGINMGMRISDLVDLKVGDLRGQRGYTYLPHKQEHKRGARNISIPIPDAVQKVIAARCGDMPDDAWLLPSRKTHPTKKKSGTQPRSPKNRERPVNIGAISRQTACRDMKEIARICGIEDRIGCHTMRKTFGYHYYRKTHNLALLQQWFYHESPATTLIYIGVTFDDFQSMVDKSPFGGMLDRAVL